MELIKTEAIPVFDLSLIHRGDCIRFGRAGVIDARNGFVTEARPDRLTVLYCNIQNNANSYLFIRAADVALGAWDIYWTQDFQTVHHEEGGDG